MSKQNHSTSSCEQFLTPEVLKNNLMSTSTYMIAFEMLKLSAINRVKQVYSRGFDDDGIVVDPNYKTDVLTKNRSSEYASLMWLQEANAITKDDIEKYTIVKQYRNKVAHEIPHMILEGLTDSLPEYFEEILSLLNKIEKWWIINYEIPVNEEFDGVEINDDEIIPGQIASLKMILDIAFGTDEEAQYYINEFRRQN